MRLKLLAAALLPLLASSPAVEARITKIVWDPARSESPTFGGTSFGSVGQYEKLRGTAYGELDPRDWRDAVIVDLDLAPRNARGMVEYSTDIFMLKPVNYNKGNRKVIFDFNNRGEMRIAILNGLAANNNPTTAADAGTGFVYNMGYTVVSTGWDPGAAGGDSMTIGQVVAHNRDGTSITGPSYEYIVFDNATTSSSPLTYAAATLDKTKAKLTARALLDDMPVVVPDSGWTYNATGTAISLTTGNFQQSWIYDFTYTAKDPIVAGIGLAAPRDFTSFLRNSNKDDFGNPNPLKGDVRQVYTYSISQPSRTLNDLVYYGFNEDEKGRQVFDGILSHTAGGAGDAINYRFAQPGRTERNRQNHLYPEGVFPFSHQLQIDPLSGRLDGRDVRCFLTNSCPKRFEMNTSNEYWVKAGSLLHTDVIFGSDLPDPPNARFYLFSGLSHGVGSATNRSTCQQFTNPTSPYPGHRALLIALDDWVTKGKDPPASRIPRKRDGNVAIAHTRPGFQTGTVSAADLGWPAIPGVTYTGVITTRYALDWGPKFRTEGIISNYPPSVSGRPSYPLFVSKVDADGNEVAGVRMPPVSAPLATTTGWGIRRAGFGANDGCEANGQNIPFQKTKAARLAAGDPRLSLEERYGTKANYVTAVTNAANALKRDRFLLQADVDAYIAEANATTAFDP
jgi:alpha/beta hydrolase family protein